MATDQTQRFCRSCQRPTLHQRQRTSEMWGCLLTLITLGLWIPIWLLMSFAGAASGYRCTLCGSQNSGRTSVAGLVLAILLIMAGFGGYHAWKFHDKKAATGVPPAVSEQEARQQAIKLHPQLGVAGSKFNADFLQRVTSYRRTKPELFTNPKWPLIIAEECNVAAK